jgi:hypothetical protein
MKRTLLVFITAALLVTGFSSCLSMKKDCNGVKHTRLKNGVYI